MALCGTAWNSYSQMSLGLGMIFDGLQCSQHLLGEYRRNHVLISVHSNSSSICLIVNPFSVVPQKKNLCVGVGSLTELEIMVWHRPLASNSLLALSTSKATFQKAFPAIILRATKHITVIGFQHRQHVWWRGITILFLFHRIWGGKSLLLNDSRF